jgi:phage gp29-like protein
MASREVPPWQRALGGALVRFEQLVGGARRRVLPPLRASTIETPRPIPPAPPTSDSQIVKRFRNADTYNSNPGHGVTVERVLGVYRQAESGNAWRQFDLFDNVIENDGHLRGLVENRILTVAGKPWVVIPGGDDEGSKSAAKALGESLANDLGFRELLEHQLTAAFYGVAVSEIDWQQDATGLVVPGRFVPIAHRRLGAPSDRVDEIHLIAGDGPGGLVPLRDHPGRYCVTRYRHRNPWAAGLMRTAVWWAVFKRWSVRDWQIFAEKFGLPFVVGYYNEGASPKTRQALEDAVKAIGEDGFAVLSDLAEIIVSSTAARSGDSSSVFPEIGRMCDAENSKLIAGGVLNTDSGQAGSYALGAVHEARGFLLALADAARIEEMFVRDLGKPFVAWNSFGGAKPPRLKVQVVREVDPLTRAQILAILAGELGMELDDAQMREEFHLRTPSGKALVGTKRMQAEKPAPAAPRPAGAGAAVQLAADLRSWWSTLEVGDRQSIARNAIEFFKGAA